MKKPVFTSLIALGVLAGCTQLNDHDRATLTRIERTTEEMRNQTAQAVGQARAAQEAANAASKNAARSAAAAEEARNKADRIFRQGQDK